jgi:two-component system KDP operon response regulator KdpE
MEQARNGKRLKVLLVEDDAAITRTLGISLRSSGFEISGAQSGERALRMIADGAFDAVILDLGLPDGLGGDVLRRLQRGGPGCSPVWVATSALDREEVERRYGPLNGPFLPKPFDPWELVRTLEELLRQ